MAIIPHDYEDLVEPSLLIPGKKPVGSVKVNTENEFGRHATHVFLDQYRNLVNNEDTTITGNVELQPRDDGERWIYIPDNGYFTSTLDSSLFGAQEGTLFFELQNNSTNNSQSCIHNISSATSLNHRVYSSRIYDNAFSSAQNISGVTPAYTITNPGFHIITSQSGTNNMKLIEGSMAGSLSVTASATRTAFGVTTPIYIGYHTHASAASYDWVGWIKHVFVFNKAFDLDALNRLSIDPYQFLEAA